MRWSNNQKFAHLFAHTGLIGVMYPPRGVPLHRGEVRTFRFYDSVSSVDGHQNGLGLCNSRIGHSRSPLQCGLLLNHCRDQRPGYDHLLRNLKAAQAVIASQSATFRRCYGPEYISHSLLDWAEEHGIATLVERSSRFVMLVKVNGKDSDSVVQFLPHGLMASLTWDRGTEMAYHRKFTVATDVSVYFCDPQSPWQRGSNENTNGLLRQYFPKGTDLSIYTHFPKGTDLSIYTQHDLDQVALRLNTRPRKALGFQTPADTFKRAVALTG
jgi:hypothetical protein